MGGRSEAPKPTSGTNDLHRPPTDNRASNEANAVSQPLCVGGYKLDKALKRECRCSDFEPDLQKWARPNPRSYNRPGPTDKPSRGLLSCKGRVKKKRKRKKKKKKRKRKRKRKGKKQKEKGNIDSEGKRKGKQMKKEYMYVKKQSVEAASDAFPASESGAT